MSRAVALALGGALLLVACALAVVGNRVQSVHLGYRLDAVQAERTELAGVLRQLEVEVAALRSPARVEARARELGLITPAGTHVRPAREYVAGDSSGAAPRHARVEAAVR